MENTRYKYLLRFVVILRIRICVNMGYEVRGIFIEKKSFDLEVLRILLDSWLYC